MSVAHIPDLKGFAMPSGRCMFLDTDERTCMIYEERPLVCRIEDMGAKIRLDRETWVGLNLMQCEILHQRVHGRPLEPEGEQCRCGAREARTDTPADKEALPPAPSGSPPDEQP